MSAKLGALVLAAALVLASAAHADTLGDVKARGILLCGASSLGTPGFAPTLTKGNWTGIGADYCRALAAAVFNDPAKVRFVTVDPDKRLATAASRKIDVLADLIPWTLGDDTDAGVRFIGPLFHDGQGFMVPKAAALNSARDLTGKEVCVDADAARQTNATDYFDANNIAARLRSEVNETAAIADYVSGNCAALTAPLSVLASIRVGLPTPGDNVLLPDLIDKEPLSVAIAQGDDRWFDIARWTFYALLDAEELGVTQTNVDEMLGSDNISVRRFLGVEADFGAEIGLNKEWAYQIIKGVGNYGDIYDRNVGEQTPLRLPRGLNALWNKGGIQYAPPVR